MGRAPTRTLGSLRRAVTREIDSPDAFLSARGRSMRQRVARHLDAHRAHRPATLAQQVLETGFQLPQLCGHCSVRGQQRPALGIERTRPHMGSERPRQCRPDRVEAGVRVLQCGTQPRQRDALVERLGDRLRAGRHGIRFGGHRTQFRSVVRGAGWDFRYWARTPPREGQLLDFEAFAASGTLAFSAKDRTSTTWPPARHPACKAAARSSFRINPHDAACCPSFSPRFSAAGTTGC